MFKKQFSWPLFLIFFVLVLGTSYGDEEEKESPRKVLSHAIKKGDLLQVQSLIESKTVGIEELRERDRKGLTPLVEAAGKGQFSIIKYLIEKGASIEGVAGKRSTPLTRLIKKASSKLPSTQLMEIIRYLVDAGVDVNSAGENEYTPLMLACKYTRGVELVEMLLDLGALADVQAADKNTAFLLCIRNTNVKAFRLLLKRGANTSTIFNGVTPLGIAAAEGKIVMAKLIIEEMKADVNKYDPAGGTPIFWAAMFGQESMVSFLAEKGADINARTINPIDVEKQPKNNYSLSLTKTYVTFPKNSTPLTFAKWAGSISTINLICDLGGIEPEQIELKEWTKSLWGL